MKRTELVVPAEQTSTPRQRILAALVAEGPLTARAISAFISESERSVVAHLEHLTRAARKVEMLPPECLECGLVFGERKRVAKPGRCPRCRGTRVRPPAFRVR